MREEWKQELLDEWAGTAATNVAKWVPYRWNFAFQLRDFEIILLLNAHNWIDTSSQNEVTLRHSRNVPGETRRGDSRRTSKRR